jgi:hypothetical protein
MAKLKYLRLRVTNKYNIHEEIKSKLKLENPPCSSVQNLFIILFPT